MGGGGISKLLFSPAQLLLGGVGAAAKESRELLFWKPKEIDIPAAVVPAQSAPTARTDTGAIIKTGTSDISNARIGRNSTDAIGAQARASTLGNLRTKAVW